jgi:hypothetical protein
MAPEWQAAVGWAKRSCPAGVARQVQLIARYGNGSHRRRDGVRARLKCASHSK